MRTVMVLLALGAVSTLLLGIVDVDAVYAPMPAKASPAGCWIDIFCKNPH